LSILRHQHGALDHVIEFTHIARKGMLQEALARRLIEPVDFFSVSSRMLLPKNCWLAA